MDRRLVRFKNQCRRDDCTSLCLEHCLAAASGVTLLPRPNKLYYRFYHFHCHKIETIIPSLVQFACVHIIMLILAKNFAVFLTWFITYFTEIILLAIIRVENLGLTVYYYRFCFIQNSSGLFGD